MAFSTIEYNDGEASTYRGIKVTYKENKVDKVIRFNTGDPVIDYYDFQLFIQEAPKEFWSENAYISGSSSWDHFMMDTNKYYESYFDPETGDFADWRTPLKENNYDLFNKITEEFPKVWHTKRMKDFWAVKKYYRKVKGLPTPESEIIVEKSLKKAANYLKKHLNKPNMDKLESNISKLEHYIKDNHPTLLDDFRKKYDEYEYSVIGILNK